MDIFNLTLEQMLMMFLLIFIGFLLRKKNILPENAGTVMAKAETWIFVPALSLFTQITKCTVESFTKNYTVMLYGLGIVMCAVLLAYPLSRLFVKKRMATAEEEYQKNVYKYALTFGNFGFMGNFIILGVWGADMLSKYLLFTFFVSAVCYSWGLYILIPKEKNAGLWANLKKGLLTPPMLALVLGILLGVLNAQQYLPAFLMKALDNAGKCQGPVAMVLAGFVIGGYNFKEIILNKKVYIVSLFRLILIPAVLMLVLRALGTSKEIMTFALICFATPLGLNTIVYPAAYGGDTKTGAAMTLISHTLAVITIPVMYLIFIALW